jgi:predicted nucleic acid-binding protein
MGRRVNFFDTNVLVAAAIPNHPHHRESFARLQKLRKSGAACAAHTLAETYNTLTRAKPYGLPPFASIKIIESARKDFSLVSLTPDELFKTLERAAQDGHIGPVIFDCLLLASARKINATAIFTSNIKDFRQIAPDLASIIREP